MYWIDINLLNDRPEFGRATVAPQPVVADSKAPMFIGLGVGTAAVFLVFGGFAVLQFLNQNYSAKEEDLKARIAQLAPQIAEVNRIQAEQQTIKNETEALARIFNQIKPWSAMLAELRNSVPPTLQIAKISQASVAPPPPPAEGKKDANAAPPPPPPVNGTSTLTLTGQAKSFSDVNDFVLTLRKSPFLNPGETKLETADLKDDKEAGIALVDYKMQTQINGVPAADLLTQLRQNGASGLVSRIETLKRQGVMKP
jgi:type IV pilus assembly protein PilN